MIELAIRGGLVVTPDGERHADIAISGGNISAIGDVGSALREIDARGRLVLPGCVDLHTHLASTPTFAPLDDFEHGTRAAIAGGVTTVVSMVYQEDGSLRRGIERGLREAERSLADYAFHVVVTDPSDAARAEIPGLVRDGHAGLKVFMVSPRSWSGATITAFSCRRRRTRALSWQSMPKTTPSSPPARPSCTRPGAPGSSISRRVARSRPR